MEQLLPIVVRNVLLNNVIAMIVELCSFFQKLCGKSLSQLDLHKIESRMIQTLPFGNFIPSYIFYNHGSFNLSPKW